MNEKRFSEIFDLYINDIFRFAYSYTHNKADSEDICQKVFMKFYKNIDKVNKNVEDTHKWLIVTAANECKDLFKSSWMKKLFFVENEKLIISENVDFDNEFAECLENLPKKYRIIFHLYYFYGYSSSEISKMLKLKESTVRQRLSRGRKMLKIKGDEKNDK